MPTITAGCCPARVSTVTDWPTVRPSSSAVPRSTAISPDRSGGGSVDDVGGIEFVVGDPEPAGRVVGERRTVVVEEGDAAAEMTGDSRNLGERCHLVDHVGGDLQVRAELVVGVGVEHDRGIDAGVLITGIALERGRHPVGEESGGGKEPRHRS